LRVQPVKNVNLSNQVVKSIGSGPPLHDVISR
jgi:hypothetical protein